MSDTLRPDLLSKCHVLYVPIAEIGREEEVESLAFETSEETYVIAFEEQSSDAGYKIGMVATRATSEQLSFLQIGAPGITIKKFVGVIESFETITRLNLLGDGDYEAQQQIAFRFGDGTLVRLRHDASNTYPYSFHLEK